MAHIKKKNPHLVRLATQLAVPWIVLQLITLSQFCLAEQLLRGQENLQRPVRKKGYSLEATFSTASCILIPAPF